MSRVFSWWFERLAEVLADLRALSPEESGDADIVETGADPATLTLPSGAKPVRLRLAPGQGLRKYLLLPAAARADLPRLLGYELERETPFSADEIWWTHRVTGRDKRHETITVELLLVPKGTVEPVLRRLHEAGITPEAIELAAPAGGFDLIPLGKAKVRRRPLDRSTRWLGLAAAGLAVAALIVPFAGQYYQLAATADEVARLKAEMATGAGAAPGAGSAGVAALVEAERRRLGHPLSALAAVTQALPDDSYLTGFSLQGGEVVLTGLSPEAAGLVGILAKSPAFHAPALAAPVVRNGAEGLESFSIKAGFGAEGEK